MHKVSTNPVKKGAAVKLGLLLSLFAFLAALSPVAGNAADCSVSFNASPGGCKSDCEKLGVSCNLTDPPTPWSWNSSSAAVCAIETPKPADPPNGAYAATMNCGNNSWPLVCDSGYSGGAATGNTGHCSATACHANIAPPANCAVVSQCTDLCTVCQVGYQLSGGACFPVSISTAAFSGVSTGALTVNWTTTFSTGTIYYVLLSSHPAYQAAFTGGTSTGTSLSFTGLEADTEYFGFVSTTSGSGYILTGSTITLQVQGSTPVVTGELGAAPMSDVTDSALTVNWNTTYSTSTTYYVRLSTISAYQAAFTTQVTTGNWYRFTGLEANKEYFGYVSTMSGSGYILVGSTTTLQVQGSTPVVTGELGAAPMSDVTDSALTVNWTTTYSTGTTYYVRLSTISAYQAAFATQLTSSASYRFTGLEANKEYFGYVSTMFGSGYIQTGSTITLAASQPDCSVAWDTSAGGCKTNCSKSAIACGWDDQKSWSSGNTLSCAVEASKPANPPNGSYPATMNCNTNTWPLICDAGYTGGAATGNTGHCSATACHANVVIANCATVNQCTDQCTACQAGYQLSGGACALLSISSAAVSGVTENALTVNWATTYSPGTVYYVRLSSSGSAVSPVSSGTTTGISYEFHGLALNTGYSGYVSTSADSGYSQVGAAYTLAQKPAGAALSPVFYSSGTFSWDVNGNPAWTEYGYILSTELDFSNIVFTGTAAVSSAEMTGLSEGTTYYGRVRAINGDGVVTDYGSAVPVATLASVSTEPAGGLGIDIFSGITSNGLTMNWTASFPGGTVYYVRLTTSASGAVPASTGTTVGLSYAFSGLVPNTTYYGFVSTSPASGFLQVDANATLAEELSGAHLAPVYCSSVVFSWSTGANPAGTLYNYLVSPELDFSRDVISGTAAVNNANVTGLAAGTAYYGMVRAINSRGIATNYASAMDIVTLAQCSAPAVTGELGAAAMTGVSTGALTVNWTTTFSTGTVYYVLLSSHPAYQAAFTGGTSSGTSLGFTGLEADTEYYGFVSTTSGSGYIQTGSTMTLQVQGSTPVVTGELGAAPMSVVSTGALTVNWTTTFSTGTVYYVLLSSHPAYQAAFTGGTSTGTSLGFTGLEADTEYYGFVSTTSGSGYILAGSTITLQVQGGTPVYTLSTAPFTNVYTSSLTANWGSTYPEGTYYYVRLSSSPSVAAYFASATTPSTYYGFASLVPATTYYAYVSTYVSGGYVQVGSGATHPGQPDCSVAWDTSAGGCKTNCSKSAIACGWDDLKSWSSGNTLSCALETAKPANPPNGSYPATMNCNTNTWPLVCDAGYTTGNTGHCSTTACHANVAIANCSVVNQCTDQCTACQAGYQLNGGACSLPSISTAPFSSVTATTLRMNWTTSFSTSTVYYARLSTGGSAADYVDWAMTLGANYTFNGLTPDTVYTGFVSTSSGSGFIQTDSAATLAQAPSGANFPTVSYSTAVLGWDTGANPAWTLYQYQLSASPDFTALAATGTTTGAAVQFTGLTGGATYYGRVRAVNQDGVYSVYSGTPTAVIPAMDPITYVSFHSLNISSMSLNWNVGSTIGAPYYVRLTTFAGSSPYVYSVTSYSNEHTFTGLTPNKEYYPLVSTVSGSGYYLGNSAFTLAAPPTSAAFATVLRSSMSITCSGGANSALTVYKYEVSTSPAFGVLTASASGNGTTAWLTGLAENTTYYGRVRAQNASAVYTSYANVPGYAVTLAPAAVIPPVPGQPAGLSGAALGVSSINWTWNSGTGSADYFALYSGSGIFIDTVPYSSHAAYVQTGLSTNTAYGIRVAGINAGGEGALTAATTVYTLAAVPNGLISVLVGSVTIRADWLAFDNPPGTAYQLWRDISAAFSQPVLSTVTASPYFATGLAPATMYYFKARALNGDGLPGGFTETGSTETLPAPPAQPAAAAGTALGVSSITWAWSAVGGATGYKVYLASEPATLLGSPATPSFVRTGLSPNTNYSIVYAAVNVSGDGPVSPAAAAVATWANPPLGLSTAAVYATSATLTWGINGNPAGTTAKVLRLVTGVNTGLTFTTENNSYTDTGLLGCTNYDFLVWNVNKAGINTGYLDVLSVLTANPVPLPPRNFSAQSLAGNQIKLAWGAAPYEGITEYQLFYDNGTGTINYGAPLATVTAVPGVYTYSYTAGGLTTGTVYKFGLQAKHRCGVLETNTNVVASAAALYSLTGVRAAIKQPQGGKTIKGNSITVMAELILGTIAETRDIRFQYKAPGPGGWSDITAKHPAQHPNPTSGWPYLIHWDVHTLPLGSYDLRAVATDNSSSHVVDANPPVITIEIVNSHADIEENENNGAVTTVQEVSNIVPNTVQTAAAGSLTTLSIPATALVETSTSVEVTNNPAYVPPDPADAQPAGVITQITLSGGQTQLANGQTATVMLTYPDVNGDGIVDETSIRASELVMYSAETAAGPWNRDLSSSVDPDNKTVIGNTSHFSFFALFAPTASDLNGVKAFPVPWKPGSNGPFDSNTVPAGITFSGMPGSAEIKIFTITGQLVRNLKLTSAQSSTVWDGKNSAGSKAASGIYLAHIKSGKKVKILKIAVER